MPDSGMKIMEKSPRSWKNEQSFSLTKMPFRYSVRILRDEASVVPIVTIK